jgi:hypothetical protein
MDFGYFVIAHFHSSEEWFKPFLPALIVILHPELCTEAPWKSCLKTSISWRKGTNVVSWDNHSHDEISTGLLVTRRCNVTGYGSKSLNWLKCHTPIHRDSSCQHAKRMTVQIGTAVQWKWHCFEWILEMGSVASLWGVLSFVHADRLVSPGIIRSLQVIAVKPTRQFALVIIHAAGTRKPREIEIEKRRKRTVKSIQEIPFSSAGTFILAFQTFSCMQSNSQTNPTANSRPQNVGLQSRRFWL